VKEIDVLRSKLVEAERRAQVIVVRGGSTGKDYAYLGREGGRLSDSKSG